MAVRGVRRRALRESLRALGATLGVGSGAALIGVLTDRLIGPGVAWWWIVAPSMGLGLVVGLMLGFARRGSPLAAASEIDRALGLHDRLGTALALESAASPEGFVALAIEEGNLASSRVDLSRALPIRLGRGWRYWPGLLALAITAGVFLPPLKLLGDDPAALERRAADERARGGAVEAIKNAAQRASDPDTAPGSAVADLAPSGAESQRGALLDEIRRELEAGATTPDEALSRAAGALDDLAGRSRQAAEALEAQADATRRALAEIPGSNDRASGAPAGEWAEEARSARDLSDSLRRGDLGGADRALSELAEQLKALPERPGDEGSAPLAEELERLAQGLEESAHRAREQADEAERAMNQPLMEQGLPPNAATPPPPAAPDAGPPSVADSSVKEAPTREEIAQSLRKRGLDEDSARRLAQKIADNERERAAHEQAAAEARRLAQAAREAAREAREPKPREQPSRKDGDQPRNQPDQRRGRDQPGDQSRPTDAEQSGDKPNSKNQPATQPKTPDRPGDPAPSAEQPPSAQEQAPAPQPGAEQPAPAPSDKPQPDSQRERKNGEKGEPTPSQQGPQPGEKGQAQDQPDPKGSQDSAPTPGNPSPPAGAEAPRREGAQPGAQREQGLVPGQREPEGKTPGDSQDSSKPSDELGAGPRGVDAMREAIERMREKRAQAQRTAERSRELEKQAREMLEKMSPEERERLERWAAEQERESSQPPTSPSPPGTPPGTPPGSPPGTSPETSPGKNPEAEGEGPVASGSDGAPSGSPRAGSPGAPSSGPPARTAPMDIRRSGEKPRVAGEWTRPQAPEDADARSSSRPISAREMEELLRDAEKSAEQAVEDQVIPKRYRNVGEFFRKARERAEKKGGEGAAKPAEPAPLAKDVEPASPKTAPK